MFCGIVIIEKAVQLGLVRMSLKADTIRIMLLNYFESLLAGCVCACVHVCVCVRVCMYE